MTDEDLVVRKSRFFHPRYFDVYSSQPARDWVGSDLQQWSEHSTCGSGARHRAAQSAKEWEHIVLTQRRGRLKELAKRLLKEPYVKEVAAEVWHIRWHVDEFDKKAVDAAEGHLGVLGE